MVSDFSSGKVSGGRIRGQKRFSSDSARFHIDLDASIQLLEARVQRFVFTLEMWRCLLAQAFDSFPLVDG